MLDINYIPPPFDYQEITKTVIDTGIAGKNDIWDYSCSPYMDHAELFFQYSQSFLQYNSARFKIDPALFFYRNDFSVNATATFYKGYYAVGINMGTLHQLYQLFNQDGKIDTDESLQLLPTIRGKFPVKLSGLLLQFCFYFILYHERAHLGQKSYLNNLLIEERYLFDKYSFNIKNHIYEFDADCDAISTLAWCIWTIWDGFPIVIRTKETYENLLCTGIASVISFFHLLMGENYSLYYAKYSHPHPAVRTAYIVRFAIDSIFRNLVEGLALDYKSILRKSISIAMIIFEIAGKKFMDVEIISKELRIIDNYIDSELVPKAYNDLSLVINLRRRPDFKQADDSFFALYQRAKINSSKKKFGYE